MDRKIPVGISIPASILDEIDVRRGDEPRSRFLLRMIEEGLELVNRSSEKDRAKHD